MSESAMTPVSLMSTGGGYDNGMSGILPAVLLSSLFGRRHDDDHVLESTIANQVSDLRRDVGETEASLKDTIHVQSLNHSQEFCTVNKNIGDSEARTSNHLANMERDLQNRIFESQKEALMANKDLTVRIMSESKDTNKNIVDESRFTNKNIDDFKSETCENFCEVKTLIKDSTQTILKQLYDDKLDEKNSVIAELRAENRAKDRDLILANELNGLKTLINSVDQNQRFYSKTVQFGAGNVALPVQTANQG